MRILVIEDDQRLARLIARVLEDEQYAVDVANDGDIGLELALRVGPEVAIIDWMLPGRDGPSICRAIRAAHLPTAILMLTARSQLEDRVSGLDSGADDYVTKPFGVDELMARVRAALRHRLQEQGSRPLFQSADLTVDLVHRRISVGGREVRLSPKEYDILQQFVIHAGKVLTHRHLLKEVWGDVDGGDVQALRVFIRQLRQKLEANPEQPRHILTEPGVGYRLQIQE